MTDCRHCGATDSVAMVTEIDLGDTVLQLPDELATPVCAVCGEHDGTPEHIDQITTLLDSMSDEKWRVALHPRIRFRKPLKPTINLGIRIEQGHRSHGAHGTGTPGTAPNPGGIVGKVHVRRGAQEEYRWTYPANNAPYSWEWTVNPASGASKVGERTDGTSLFCKFRFGTLSATINLKLVYPPPLPQVPSPSLLVIVK